MHPQATVLPEGAFGLGIPQLAHRSRSGNAIRPLEVKTHTPASRHLTSESWAIRKFAFHSHLVLNRQCAHRISKRQDRSTSHFLIALICWVDTLWKQLQGGASRVLACGSEISGSLLCNPEIPYWTFGGLLGANVKTSTHGI
jgi:hypothetical protein